jgi:hypothetical protein
MALSSRLIAIDAKAIPSLDHWSSNQEIVASEMGVNDQFALQKSLATHELLCRVIGDDWLKTLDLLLAELFLSQPSSAVGEGWDTRITRAPSNTASDSCMKATSKGNRSER